MNTLTLTPENRERARLNVQASLTAIHNEIAARWMKLPLPSVETCPQCKGMGCSHCGYRGTL